MAYIYTVRHICIKFSGPIYLDLLGIRGWRRIAENRDDCRCLMWEAKAQKEL